MSTRAGGGSGSVLRKKDIPTLQRESAGETELKRSLGVWSLTAIGLGAIIGVGVFVLTGTVAANQAGPAVALSFVIAGLASAAAALCYAEFASMIPVSGSAYTYSYAVLGELFAWFIGWDLLLEYTLVVAVVAIGLSGYVNELLSGLGFGVPESLAAAPADGGVVNLFAVLLCLFIAGLQIRGTQESARFNNVMVVLKLAIIVVIIAVGIFFVNPANLTPFMPFGLGGVLAGAGVVFFAVFGYDTLTTAAEESVNPQRDLPRAVLLSLAIAMVLYVLMSVVVTGMVPYNTLGDTDAPVAFAFRQVGLNSVAIIISVAAIAGIVSVLYAFMLGAARVWFAISRDGLLPRWFARPHPSFRTPYRPTLIIGIVTAVVAGFIPIETLAVLVNIGVLSAFVVVCASVLILRRRSPEMERGFRTPLMPFTPIFGILASLLLIYSLGWETLVRFVIWLLIGLVIYFLYSRRNSLLARGETGLEREPAD